MPIIDPTGVVLTPGNDGADCLGNGFYKDERGKRIAARCKNCAYFLCCNTPNNDICCRICKDRDCPRANG